MLLQLGLETPEVFTEHTRLKLYACLVVRRPPRLHGLLLLGYGSRRSYMRSVHDDLGYVWRMGSPALHARLARLHHRPPDRVQGDSGRSSSYACLHAAFLAKVRAAAPTPLQP